ncbi:hypothetical protein HDU97_005370 [Phlyctochytrium planicorne]|nr:hypothetical protein HDU97_005370 [Phlyctochytrium planicorne]
MRRKALPNSSFPRINSHAFARYNPKISIVLATKNDASCIVRTLIQIDQCRTADLIAVEVVIADGFSVDGTLDCVNRLDATFELKIVRGVVGSRGRRFNVGARAATGDIVMFMHPDILLPKAFDRLVSESLHQTTQDQGYVAGSFAIASESTDPTLAPLMRTINIASRFLDIPFHQAQAIFTLRKTFVDIGGFPDQPLFETFDLVKRLNQVGRFRMLQEIAMVSLEGGRCFGVGEGFADMVECAGGVLSTEAELSPLKYYRAVESYESDPGRLKKSFFSAAGDIIGEIESRADEDSLTSWKSTSATNALNAAWSVGMRFGGLGGPTSRAALATSFCMILYAYFGVSADRIYCLLYGVPGPGPGRDERATDDSGGGNWGGQGRGSIKGRHEDLNEFEVYEDSIEFSQAEQDVGRAGGADTDGWCSELWSDHSNLSSFSRSSMIDSSSMLSFAAPALASARQYHEMQKRSPMGVNIRSRTSSVATTTDFEPKSPVLFASPPPVPSSGACTAGVELTLSSSSGGRERKHFGGIVLAASPMSMQSNMGFNGGKSIHSGGSEKSRVDTDGSPTRNLG